MLDSAREAQSFVQGRTRHDLDTDRMVTLALVKCIEIIGEAASAVSATTTQRLSSIPWRNIIGMRNRLVHDYTRIDLDILWTVATLDLPALISELEKSISDSEGVPEEG